MKQLTGWLSQFQSWAHWFAGVALSAALIYSTNDAVQDATGIHLLVVEQKAIEEFLR